MNVTQAQSSVSGAAAILARRIASSVTGPLKAYARALDGRPAAPWGDGMVSFDEF